MYPRIRNVTLRPVRLTPTAAELAVEVDYTFPKPTTELRGRLVGPTCLYSTTIEIAYPVRMLPRAEPALPVLYGRVVIPEPSWWSPESPFLYAGVIELWEEETKVGEVRVRCGLRHFALGPTGLRWNGHPLQVRGVRREDCSIDAMRELRATGYNLLLLPFSKPAGPLWDAADRIGMLVLRELRDADDAKWATLPGPVVHPSLIGYVARPVGERSGLGLAYWAQRCLEGYGNEGSGTVGQFANHPGDIFDRARFILCPAEGVGKLAGIDLPKFAIGPPGAAADESAVVGLIEE